MKNQKGPLDKFGIAAALQEIAALLEVKGGEYFKARAFKIGARAVAELREDLGTLIKQNRLTFIKGIGITLAKQIEELYTSGESKFLQTLRAELPKGILELSNIPGLNLKKIERLQQAGITNLDDLRAACEAHQIRNLKGFGPKTEQKILEAITRPAQSERRIHIHHALRIGEGLLEYLETAPGFIAGELAGSLRRRAETVADIAVVVSVKQPEKAIDYFLRFPLIVSVQERSNGYCSVILNEGVVTHLFAVKPRALAATLLRATGSEAHLKRLDQAAAAKNLSITTNGIEKLSQSRRKHKASARLNEIQTEAEIYQRLGMQWIPPELREDNGEIEAALKGSLPEDLITIDDLKGMVHCHTTYSDGKHSIEQMVYAAQSMGMKYITITDHSPTAFYAGGVKVDQLQRQWEEIDRVQEQARIKILKGTESDILADGSLDYPDWVLEQFDVIVASIHSRYKMDEEKMTRRVITAMRQPVFKIWGHALGRLIDRRPPFDCRVEEILDVIAESRAAIEINGDPYRLDMEPRWLREARKRKIKFVISVDAHSTGSLNNVKFGVGIARRGWVRRSEVLNTLAVKRFQKAVRPL